MFSHHTIKVTMMFVIAVVLVNLANYIFYVYYNPSTEALSLARRPMLIEKSGVIWAPDGSEQLSNNLVNDKLCPAVPPGLGPVSVDAVMFSYREEDFYSVVSGVNKIKTCVPRERAAIIVLNQATAAYPFEFVNYMHWFMRKQQLEYQVFVVRQSAETPYHRGRIINAAFKEILKVQRKPFECFIIHDSSIIPLDTRNIYRCSWYPRQLVAKLHKKDKVLSYESTFGGAIAVTHEQFVRTNGFSNIHENNAIFVDMAKRLAALNYTLERTPSVIGNYTTLKTFDAALETESPMAGNSSRSSLTDGLTSVTYLVEEYLAQNSFVYLQIGLSDPEANVGTYSAQSIKNQESVTALVDDNIDIKIN